MKRVNNVFTPDQLEAMNDAETAAVSIISCGADLLTGPALFTAAAAVAAALASQGQVMDSNHVAGRSDAPALQPEPARPVAASPSLDGPTKRGGAVKHRWLWLDSVANVLVINEGNLRRRCAEEWAAQGLARKHKNDKGQLAWQVRSDVVASLKTAHSRQAQRQKAGKR